jgi:myo-inositol 2-dehydrogenase / D-chiro-inositol 1-dehydrogenase
MSSSIRNEFQGQGNNPEPETVMTPFSRDPALTRRGFLKTAAAATAPLVIPARIRRGPRAPSNQILCGCLGVGRQGRGDMQELIHRGLEAGARVVAVCDVDKHRREDAQWLAERIYASEQSPPPGSGLAAYGDFREMLARPDIDAVLVASPDHWHGLHALAAAEAGKDLYVEKPLTYTIGEGRRLVEAVRRGRRILQVGSQQRSSVYFRLAAEAVRNKRIGTLRRILVTLPVDAGRGDPRPMPTPRFLDYDLWMGPTAEAAYTEDRVHPVVGYERPGWMQIERYCRGMISNWGAHMIDSAQWGHGADDTGPIEIEARGEFPDRGLFDVHTSIQGQAVFADGVVLRLESGEPGVRFEGDSGWVSADRGQVRASTPSIIRKDPASGEVRLPVSGSHMRDFLEAVRGRHDPIAPVEAGHRSNSICVLFHLAMKLGRRLKWDPAEEIFPGDAEATDRLRYPYREPWR